MRRILIILLFFSLHAWVQGQSWVVSSIVISGNDVTKPQVILRELPFAVGDTIDNSALEELAKQGINNLTNTSLFNFTHIKHVAIDSSFIRFEVEVDERWYIWPGVVFSLAETNFNSWWENKDFDRINYGLFVEHQNFRGRQEKLTLGFQYGWKRKIDLKYQIPGINRKRTLGAGIEFFYANNREINYGTLNNEREFFKAGRFIQEEFGVIGKLEYRPKFYNRHRFNLGFETVVIDDTVKEYTLDYLPNNLNRSQYLVLSYGFKREKRDNRAYPLVGYVIDGSLDQNGIGLLQKNDVLLTAALFTMNMHHHLGGRWYFAHGFKGKATVLGEPTYYFQKGLGYSNAFMRGYELVVIDGQHYGLYKSNIKFQLLKKRSTDLKMNFIDSFDKFHYSVFLNVFGDAGYVVDNINPTINPLANTLQYGYGVGLDLVTYYDIVVRFEGSINKSGIPAFYIHFKNPI